jgi:predicted helicase
MTATPRLFDPNTKEKAKDASAVLASMDDEAVFGPVLHRLGFGEAVEKNLLTDYRVLVLTVDEQYVAENFQKAIAHSGEIQMGDAAKIVGCWNGLAKKFGTRSTPTAASTSRRCAGRSRSRRTSSRRRPQRRRSPRSSNATCRWWLRATSTTAPRTRTYGSRCSTSTAP